MAELDQYEKICGQIFRQVSLLPLWRWDNEHGVALVTLDESKEGDVLGALVSAFDDEWDMVSIEEAPSDFWDFYASSFGIVFPGQKVFTVEREAFILFALWWPWGDSKKFSLRIGLLAKKTSPDSAEMIEQRLRMWFAI